MKKNNYLSKDIVAKINAYWRAANYLSIGQIYLYDGIEIIGLELYKRSSGKH